LFSKPACKACNAALSSHLHPSAIVLLRHRPYGSAKLRHAKISSATLTNRASKRCARPEAIEPGADTGRVKAGEACGSLADNPIGGNA
jgi:hypothetical protein